MLLPLHVFVSCQSYSGKPVQITRKQPAKLHAEAPSEFREVCALQVRTQTRFHCAQNKLGVAAWDSASVQQYLKSWCSWLCIQCRLTTTRSDLICELLTIYGRCMFWKQGSVDVCSSMSFKTISDCRDPMCLTTHDSFISCFKLSCKNVLNTILGLRL